MIAIADREKPKRHKTAMETEKAGTYKTVQAMFLKKFYSSLIIKSGRVISLGVQ